MTDWQAHDKRAQELGDSIRRYLVAAHTGGMGVTFALAASMVESKIRPVWAVPAVIAFVVGLTLAGISMFLAQHREIRRRDAMKANAEPPTFSRWIWSWPWNGLSLIAFVVAIGVGLNSLSCITIP